MTTAIMFSRQMTPVAAGVVLIGGRGNSRALGARSSKVLVTFRDRESCFEFPLKNKFAFKTKASIILKMIQ